jgi:hypothetical protein
VPNGTRLVFTPSCLIERPPIDDLERKQTRFDPSAPEVVYDRERLRELTEEEARIWLEVFRLRHGDREVPILVRTFELDKLPQFQKLLGSLPEQIPMFEEGKGKEKEEEEPENTEEELDFDF